MEHIQTAMLKSGIGHLATWRADASVPRLRPPRDAVWTTLPFVKADPGHLEANRIVTAGKSDPAQGAFDMMRTRVLHLLRQNGWTTIAITSPAHGGGKSVVALNLAFSLANHQDCRTVLVDLDLRRPRIASALGLGNPPAIEDYLRGQAGVEQSFRRLGPNLAIAPNGRPVRLSAELLQGPGTAAVFRELKQALMPDIIICDLPPMLATDDAMAFLPNADCAILVAEAEVNTLEEVDACEQELALQIPVLGTVLNKCRHCGETAAYRSEG